MGSIEVLPTPTTTASEAKQKPLAVTGDAEIQIPAHYKHLLEPAEVLDKRSDEEILQSLTEYRPVVDEKNIWAFWHAGVRSMPQWNQRNVVDWVRICGPSDWTIRVLDSVPNSENNAMRYIEPSLLPEAYRNGSMEGAWKGAHSADFIRTASLVSWGGLSMDVGCILFRDLDRVCWNKLTEPGSPYRIATPHLWGQTIANYFVAARKDDPLIKRWHNLFIHLWSGHTSAGGLADDPLVSSIGDMVGKTMKEANGTWKVHVSHKTLVEYMTQAVCWNRCVMLEDVGDGFCGVDYWMNNVWLFDAVTETIGGPTKIGFEQGKIFQYLTMDRNFSSSVTAEQQQGHKEAEDLAWFLLTGSSMLKISRGPGLTKHKGFGALLDLPENRGKDCAPGTFFELLRFGSLHYKQTRSDLDTVKPIQPPITLRKGLLEA